MLMTFGMSLTKSESLILMDESTGSIDADVYVDVQMNDKIETEHVTGSEKLLLVIKVESVGSKENAEGTLILKESKEEVEDIWSEAEELVQTINHPAIMTSDSMVNIDEAVVLLDTKVNANVSGRNKN